MQRRTPPPFVDQDASAPVTPEQLEAMREGIIESILLNVQCFYTFVKEGKSIVAGDRLQRLSDSETLIGTPPSFMIVDSPPPLTVGDAKRLFSEMPEDDFKIYMKHLREQLHDAKLGVKVQDNLEDHAFAVRIPQAILPYDDILPDDTTKKFFSHLWEPLFCGIAMGLYHKTVTIPSQAKLIANEKDDIEHEIGDSWFMAEKGYLQRGFTALHDQESLIDFTDNLRLSSRFEQQHGAASGKWAH